MENNFVVTNGRHVVTSRNEFFGIACLAIIGAASIIGCVANGSYRLGRDTKEFEMKREFKKYMKKLKKSEP